MFTLHNCFLCHKWHPSFWLSLLVIHCAIEHWFFSIFFFVLFRCQRWVNDRNHSRIGSLSPFLMNNTRKEYNDNTFKWSRFWTLHFFYWETIICHKYVMLVDVTLVRTLYRMWGFIFLVAMIALYVIFVCSYTTGRNFWSVVFNFCNPPCIFLFFFWWVGWEAKWSSYTAKDNNNQCSHHVRGNSLESPN